MERVGWRFITLYTLAFMGTCLVLVAPLLVTLALKVNSLTGIEKAPQSLALVTGIGALVAMFGNPFFGRMSDRTSSRLGMRRPWMVIGLVGGTIGILLVAVAPTIPVVLVGWCTAQLFFNALLAAQVAVLPDQVPVPQRGLVSGVLGVCLPVASISGTYVVQLFSGHDLAMFLAPCAIGGFFIVLFAVTLPDRRLAVAERPTWSMREFLSTFYVDPRRQRDFSWAFASRFMFVMAYAFLVTYQAYYLLEKIGSDEHDVPRQIFLGTLVQSVVVVCCVADRWQAVRPDGAPEDLRADRRDGLRPGDAGDRGRQRLQRLPRRYGDRRPRVRGLRRRRPRAGRGRAAGRRQHRQGPRCLQHGRRPALLRGAGSRAGHPGPGRRQLRRAVRRRRVLRAHSQRSPSCP